VGSRKLTAWARARPFPIWMNATMNPGSRRSLQLGFVSFDLLLQNYFLTNWCTLWYTNSSWSPGVVISVVHIFLGTILGSKLYADVFAEWDRLRGLVVRVPGYRSRRYQIFWEVVGLERVPLSLVSTIEELLGRKSSGSGLDSREYGSRDPSRWPRGTV
jgi:hypothetical protein